MGSASEVADPQEVESVWLALQHRPCRIFSGVLIDVSI